MKFNASYVINVWRTCLWVVCCGTVAVGKRGHNRVRFLGRVTCGDVVFVSVTRLEKVNVVTNLINKALLAANSIMLGTN